MVAVYHPRCWPHSRLHGMCEGIVDKSFSNLNPKSWSGCDPDNVVTQNGHTELERFRVSVIGCFSRI